MMDFDFDVNRVSNYIGLIVSNNYTQTQLNCLIESCFKISYSIISSYTSKDLQLDLTEDEKIDLGVKSISSIFGNRMEETTFQLSKLVHTKLGSNKRDENLLFTLYKIIKEKTLLELQQYQENSFSCC